MRSARRTLPLYAASRIYRLHDPPQLKRYQRLMLPRRVFALLIQRLAEIVPVRQQSEHGAFTEELSMRRAIARLIQRAGDFTKAHIRRT